MRFWAVSHEPCGLPDASIDESVPQPFLPRMPNYPIPVRLDSKVISKLALPRMNVFELAVVEVGFGDIDAVELVGYDVEFVVGGDVVVHASAMAAAGIAGVLGIACAVAVVAELRAVVEKGGSGRPEVVREPR